MLEHKRSSGQVEEQINRLKLIERQMYGRASFDLLRQGVLGVARCRSAAPKTRESRLLGSSGPDVREPWDVVHAVLRALGIPSRVTAGILLTIYFYSSQGLYVASTILAVFALLAAVGVFSRFRRI